MERVVRKVTLEQSGNGADPEVLRMSPEERMNLFGELLRRGEAFYNQDEITKGYPRVYRVINLRES